ncbi:MAG TPA: putative glycoside hydrolase, partial [Burkholderiales bacterium]
MHSTIVLPILLRTCLKICRVQRPAIPQAGNASALPGPSLPVAARNVAAVLRSAALAVLLGTALPLAAQTGSSKFIPTFLVYYGGGPALVSTDAAKLAKYDLIDIDRFRYNQIGSNTWNAIKSVNPTANIYLYQMGAEAPSYLDGTLPLYLNGLGRYNISRGLPMGSLNGNHPELFQLDAAGNRIYNVAFSNPGAGQYWYLMDFGSSAYQSYWVSATKADIVDQPWVADGIFVDNCVTTAAAAGYNATSAWYSTNAAWSGAMNSFVTGVSAGMHSYGQKLWCNKGDTRFADGVAAWLALDASATPPDVLLEEG